jgi:hypothetical protein
MKTEGQIKQKLKQAQFRHVKRLLRKRFPPGSGPWPEEEVRALKGEYREFFSTAPLPEIAQDFPDVAALLWILNGRPDEPLVPNGSLVGSLGGVMLWADGEAEAVTARALLDRVFEELLKPRIKPNTLVVGGPDSSFELPLSNGALPAQGQPVAQSWWKRWFS